MRIAVFGASGQIGRHVVAEANRRNHEVTAIARESGAADGHAPRVATARGDAMNAGDVARISRDHDLVVSATRPPAGHEPELVETARALLRGVAASHGRLLLVGGAASLGVPGGGTVLEDPELVQDGWRAISEACAEQLEVCRADDHAEWTYVSPPASIGPGERTETFRLGCDELVVDERGRSHISLEDFAVAVLDEAERPRHRRARFTVGY